MIGVRVRLLWLVGLGLRSSTRGADVGVDDFRWADVWGGGGKRLTPLSLARGRERTAPPPDEHSSRSSRGVEDSDCVTILTRAERRNE